MTKILANLPQVGTLKIRGDFITPKGWQKERQKYIGQLDILATNRYGLFNYFILDVDIKNALNPSLPLILQHLETLSIPLDTFTVMSKSGGIHLYYLAPDFPFKNPTGWMKTDNAIIDIRGYTTWVVAPSRIATEENPWQPGEYVVINDTPPVTFTPKALIEPLKIDNTVTSFKKNMDYYMSMDEIPEGCRNDAAFQIIEELHRRGMSEEEVQQFFDNHVQPKVKDYAGMMENVNLGYRYARAEEKKTEGGKLNKLVQAMRNFYYVMDKDMIFDATKREAYSRSHFMYTTEDKYTFIQDGKEHNTSLTKTWLAQDDKKRVHSIGWQPGDNVVYTYLGRSYANMYRNQRAKRLAHKVTSNHPMVKAWLDIISNVFMDDKKLMAIYISSIRWQLEHPLDPRIWALIIIGTKGPGKGTLWKTLCKLLGNGMSVDPALLKKEFNTYLFQHESILFNEFDTQDKIRYGIIKEYITENEHTRTGKGTNTEDIPLPTYFSVEIHANSFNNLRLDKNDRRYFLIHCTAPKLENKFGKEFVHQYYKWLETDEFKNTLYTYIMDTPYSPDFNHSMPYRTHWYEEICIETKTDIAKDILDGLSQENIYSQSDIQTVRMIRHMLIYQFHYLEGKLTSGAVGRAVNELVNDGTFKWVENDNRSGKRPRVRLPAINMDTPTLQKEKKTVTDPMIIIRNAKQYKTVEDAKKAFYPFI